MVNGLFVFCFLSLSSLVRRWVACVMRMDMTGVDDDGRRMGIDWDGWGDGSRMDGIVGVCYDTHAV